VSEPALEIHASADAGAAAAADRIAAALTAAVERRGWAHWATTGGSTPVAIYRALADDPYRRSVPWDRVHVWWGDDRFVPRDHPLSNVLPLDQVLVRASAFAGISGAGDVGPDVEQGLEAGVYIPSDQIHAMPMGPALGAGHDTAWVASRYGEALRAAGLPPAANGYPTLDVIVLGAGPDGHILSCFPGSTAFDGAWVAAVPAPTHLEPKVPRVSLHPAFVEAAREAIVMAYGAGKADMLATALASTIDPARWPIQHARRSNATWILDEAAAAKLDR